MSYNTTNPEPVNSSLSFAIVGGLSALCIAAGVSSIIFFVLPAITIGTLAPLASFAITTTSGAAAGAAAGYFLGCCTDNMYSKS